MSQPTAIIVGAGIGGLATAIQLAKNGVKVTIYEKNSQPGGRCQQIIKDGHVFDTGPTMFIFPEIYTKFFSAIGEDLTQYLKLIPTDPSYQLNFGDNTHLTLTSNLESMRIQLEAIETGSFQRFLEHQQAAKNYYDLTIDNILSKSFASPLDYLSLNFYRLLNSRALTNHYAYAKRYFKHPNLIAAFTFQDSYLSLNPFEAQAIYSMFSYTELNHGNYLPEGGMYQVIQALVTIAKKYGVNIYCQNEIKKINVQDNHASSVTLHDNSIKAADYIIINADLSYAYRHLLPKKLDADKLNNKKYSCSAIVFHWGLDKTYPQLKTHNLFFSKSYQAGFDQVINHSKPPLYPHFYIQAPAHTDPTRAPANQDTISIMIPINHLNPSHPVDWEKYQTEVRKYVISRLLKAGLSDIKQHIKFEKSYLPSDWQNYHNLPYGAIYGLHHNLAQLGPFRPSRIHNKYKNLFFVGASTHPGSGLPTVLLSSQFTSQAILKTINS